MKLTTKGDLVLAALRKAGIASNATLVDTEPQSVQEGMDDLELMLDEWAGGNNRGIDIGYHFSPPGVPPSPGDAHGLPGFAINAVILCLTTRIITDYGREPPVTLIAKAAYGKERIIKIMVQQRTPRLKYPARMPVGSGNHFINGRQYFGVYKNANDSTADSERSG